MIKQPLPDVIAEAATLLKAGELVAFPTETVYGLGADATNSAAVEKIYAAKGRPAHNPLIAHVDTAGHAASLVRFDERAWTIAESLWPGPITLLLPAMENNRLSKLATAGLPNITVRVPAHPVAMDLLKAVGFPIVAPSANKSGNLSPTNAEHVARSLGSAVKLILAGGSSSIGLESTILDLTAPQAKILRPGAIGVEELESLIGPVAYAQAGSTVTAPGQLARHYATETPLRLNAVDVKEGEAFLGFGNTSFIGVEKTGFVKDMDPAWHRNLSPEGDLHQAATHLYAALHELDQLGAKAIAVQPIPLMGLGIALNDRLRRAAVSKE